jgi:hypothetical protein
VVGRRALLGGLAAGAAEIAGVSQAAFKSRLHEARLKLRETAPRQQFAAADKASCVGEEKLGPLPSYTDLVTCLEMARDARKSTGT